MTREELQEWKALQGGQKKKPEVKAAEVLATLRPPNDFTAKMRREVMAALKELKKQFGLSIEGPPDPEEQQANAIKAINDKIRKDTSRYIRELKSERLKTDGVRKLTKSQRKERWPYSEDQVNIASDADWGRCEEVLNLLGVGDEFGRIKEGALRLHGYTEAMLKKHENDDQDETLKELKVILTGEHAERASVSGRKGDDRAAAQ